MDRFPNSGQKHGSNRPGMPISVRQFSSWSISRCRVWMLAGWFFAGCLVGPGLAQQPVDDGQKLLQQAEALEAQAQEKLMLEQQSQETAASARQQLFELQQAVLRLKRSIEEIAKAIGAQQTEIQSKQEAAAQAEAARVAAAQALEEARQKLAEATKAAEEATTAAAQSQQAAQTAAATLAETRARSTATEQEQQNVEQQLVSVQTSLVNAEAETLAQREARIALLRQAEQLRAQAGAWVSFAAEVAPVFHKRCLACHNARTAKGRFNMESYAAIMKGGESGPAVVPGHPDESGLCLYIEDGSMPQDADPLTSEQMAVVRRWVELGARLDAGKDEQAPLIRVMPKFPQPSPPEVYPVAVPVTALAFHPSGEWLASGGYHELLLWQVSDGQLARRITNVAERIHDISFHPEGHFVAVAAGNPGQLGEVKVFRPEDGTLVADLVTVEDAMFGVSFSPDGSRLAACGADRSVRLFNVEGWEQTRVIEDHADWVLAIAWSPDGSKLVSGSRDKTAKVFDAMTGEALVTFNTHGEAVSGVAVLSDNKHAVSAGRDKRVRVWDLAEAKQSKEITGFGDELTRITVAPDDRIFSACADQRTRGHKPDGSAAGLFEGHRDWVYSIAVHPGTKRLASGSYDGEIRVWSLEDAQLLLHWLAAPGR